MQVELYVQDCFDESSPEESVDSSAGMTRITTETWENWFRRWMSILHDDIPLAPAYEIGLRLTDDIEIQEMNTQYRHQNKPTDVLSFAALETAFPSLDEIDDTEVPLYLGDIVISIETAQRQAHQQQHSLVTELAWLAAHGLLHLLGWDHPDEESLSKMLNKQVILLEYIGIDINIE